MKSMPIILPESAIPGGRLRAIVARRKLVLDGEV